MSDPFLKRIPMVAGLAYIERIRRLPASTVVSLQAEEGNRYFLQAIAVMAAGEKVGYVAPEVSRRYHAPLVAHGAAVTCPARRASSGDHQTSGVELLLDFSALAIEPAP